jgi:3'(2'), 5'-bisphosphate nucleotidase
MIDVNRAAEVALETAHEASALVLRVYEEPFEVEFKSENDPVTRADRESNALICERLDRAFPGIPIVAEESPATSYAGFERSETVWFVDPLDGTREFVAKNGEFAVMIGLSEGGRAKLGVIVAPTWNRTFLGIVGEGAWQIGADGSREPIHVSTRPRLEGARIVVSRSHRPPRIDAFVAAMGAREALIYGSAGLKAVLVATGDCDVFLQPLPAGMRWDACASEAIVKGAGGEWTDARGAVFDYKTTDLANRAGMIGTNSLLHAATIAALRT